MMALVLIDIFRSILFGSSTVTTASTPTRIQRPIPAVLLGSISRENPKVSVLRLFRIQR